LGDGKRVRSLRLTGILAWVEPVYAAGSSDIKKCSRLIIKSADARYWIKRKKKIYQTGLAPVKQKTSISKFKNIKWN
jgi:hypothetical protein